jgi:hypothetical protein
MCCQSANRRLAGSRKGSASSPPEKDATKVVKGSSEPSVCHHWQIASRGWKSNYFTSGEIFFLTFLFMDRDL